MEIINIKFLLKVAYLTLYQYGYSEVSLKNEQLLDYVPKIEKMLVEYGLQNNDLFIKTPVEEMYDEYKNFLIEEFYGKKLGCFNEKYDTIILKCPDFYIWKCQESVYDYKELVRKCCYLISRDVQFVDDNIIEKPIEKKKQYKIL